MDKNIFSFDSVRIHVVATILLFSVLMLGNTALGAVDTTPPVLTDVSILSDNANTSYAEAGDIIILMFAASETITTPTVTINGNLVADITNLVDNIWSAAWLVPEGSAEGEVEFTIDFSDNASNAGAQVTATTDGSGVTYDKEQPLTFCGDNTCDADENCTTCASDCGFCIPIISRYIIPPHCGDDICQENEDCSICESDCGACPEEPDVSDSTGNIDVENNDSGKTISEPEKTSALVEEKAPLSLTGLMLANINDSKTGIAAILVFVCALLLVNHFYISKKKK